MERNKKKARATMKLAHGRITVTENSVFLNLMIDCRKEVTPVAEMLIDTLQAKEFANEVIYGISGWPYGVSK